MGFPSFACEDRFAGEKIPPRAVNLSPACREPAYARRSSPVDHHAALVVEPLRPDLLFAERIVVATAVEIDDVARIGILEDGMRRAQRAAADRREFQMAVVPRAQLAPVEDAFTGSGCPARADRRG